MRYVPRLSLLPIRLTSAAMPPSSSIQNKRFLTLLIAAIGLVSLISLFFSGHHRRISALSSAPAHQVNVDENILKGEVVASKLENATVKAELGRAAWKVIHTTMAKFPDKPTQDEQTALFSFIHLFARLYPWYDTWSTKLETRWLMATKRRMRCPFSPDPRQIPPSSFYALYGRSVGLPCTQRGQQVLKQRTLRLQ